MPHRSRRRFLAAAAAGVVGAHLPRARAQLVAQPLEPLIAKLTGNAAVQAGRVALEIPRLADNGHSVPLRVRVDSAMTEADHVKTIHILSGRNPRPHVAAFHLNPHCGRAEISTRVRLNGTQRLVVLAQTSDGAWWSASAEVEVTETACLDAT